MKVMKVKKQKQFIAQRHGFCNVQCTIKRAKTTALSVISAEPKARAEIHVLMYN